MYAKLVNGALRRAPKTVKYNGKTIINPPDNTLAELGYYPVVYTDMPTDVTENEYYSPYWEQTEDAIVQRWQSMKVEPVVEVPTDTERIDTLEQAFLEFVEVMIDG